MNIIILFINHQNKIKMRLLVFLVALCFTTTLQAQTEQRDELMVRQGFFSPIFYINGEKTIRGKFVSKINLDKEATRLFKKGVKTRAIGYTVSILGAVVAGAEYGRRSANKKLTYTTIDVTPIDNIVLYGGGIAVLGGIFVYYSATSWQKRATWVYNNEASSSSLHLGPTRNGVGLTLTF